MLRILIILSALCLLLLLGYVTMNKGKMTENIEANPVTNSASIDQAIESHHEELTTAKAAEKTIRADTEGVKNIKNEIEEIPHPFQEAKSREIDVKSEDKAIPEVDHPKMTVNNKRENISNYTSEKWATLEETQQVLDDTDRLLEINFTERRTK